MKRSRLSRVKRFCWTGSPSRGGLTGCYGDTLAECRAQAKECGVNVKKDEYYEGRTPKELLKVKK